MAGATLVVTPELSLCGYPPEDLLSAARVLDACAAELAALAAQVECGARSSSAFRERDGGGATTRRCRARRSRAAGLPQADAAELHGIRRRALFRARQRALRVRRRRRRVRPHHLRGRLVPRAGGAREGAGAQMLVVVPNGSPYHTRQQALRAGAGRCARPREPDCRSSTSIASAARTSSCSTAPRLSSTREGALAQQVPAWHEAIAWPNSRAPRRSGCAARSIRALEPHVYQALVLGVRDYVDKNGFPGVLLGRVGGRGLCVDARDCCRRARPGSRARGDAAVPVQRADEPRRCARDGAASWASAMTRSPIEPVHEAMLAVLAAEFAAGRRTLPRRTCRRASAARS